MRATSVASEAAVRKLSRDTTVPLAMRLREASLRMAAVGWDAKTTVETGNGKKQLQQQILRFAKDDN